MEAIGEENDKIGDEYRRYGIVRDVDPKTGNPADGNPRPRRWGNTHKFPQKAYDQGVGPPCIEGRPSGTEPSLGSCSV